MSMNLRREGGGLPYPLNEHGRDTDCVSPALSSSNRRGIPLPLGLYITHKSERG